MRASLVMGLVVAVALATQGHAQAQAQGSVVVLLNGVDISTAATTPSALGLDAAAPAQLTARITAPPDASWSVGAVRVTLLATEGVAALTRELPVDQTIAPGETLVVEREADVAAMRAVGAGVFRMEVDVLDADGAVLSSTPFFVRVAGNPFATLIGGVALVLTGVAAYGLWQLLRDLREFWAAYQRHRKEEAREGKVARLAGAAIDLSAGVEGVVTLVEGADPEAERLARRRWIKWTLTGLGLGSVAVSWGQALGSFPIDVATLALGAAGGAFVFLMLSLLAAAWAGRVHRKRHPSAPKG